MTSVAKEVRKGIKYPAAGVIGSSELPSIWLGTIVRALNHWTISSSFLDCLFYGCFYVFLFVCFIFVFWTL